MNVRGSYRFAHLLGLSAFLGSVCVYILISSLIASDDLQALALSRRIIRTGTLCVTVPGLWLLVASGVVPAIRVLRRSRPSWLVAKLGLVLVLLLNTHLVVVPATGRALALASASAARGSLEAGYHAAYLVESLAGTANVLLLFGIAALAIWKPVRRRPAHAGPLRPAEPRLVR